MPKRKATYPRKSASIKTNDNARKEDLGPYTIFKATKLKFPSGLSPIYASVKKTGSDAGKIDFIYGKEIVPKNTLNSILLSSREQRATYMTKKAIEQEEYKNWSDKINGRQKKRK